MKHLVFLLFMAFFPIVANADAVEINGIYYNLITKAKTAEVTSNPNEYTGSVNIPASVIYNGVEYIVTSISDFAFFNDNGITSVTIPNSIIKIGEHAFGWIELTSVHISDLVSWCNISFGDDASNPLSVAGHLYLGEEEIKDLVIPNSVTSIGNYAFCGGGEFSSVTIPSGVTSIGTSAFSRCSSLPSVTIPGSVKSIGDGAFSGCSGLTSVTIPNSVTSIGESAFSGCSGLTSVTIPNSVTSIGSRAFYNCSGLTAVTIPNSVTGIGDYTFYGCSSLTSVTFPSSVTTIGDYAFYDCSSLATTTIPNGVTKIGNHSFEGCSGLNSLTMGNSLTSVGESAFSGCSSLTSVQISDIAVWCHIFFRDYFSNPLSLAHRLYLGEKEIVNLFIPNDVTSIGQYAFYGCTGFTSVTIPNNVTSIGERAFNGCSSLNSLIIGSGISNIGSLSFADCEELMDVYCLSEKVPSMYSYGWGTVTNAFQGSYVEYATLHVPGASIEAYRAVEPWKNFKSIVALDGNEIPDPQKCATPTISFVDGKLKFCCETEDVEYVSEVTATEAKKYYSDEVALGGTYTVSVYAIKQGWEDSDVATMEFTLGRNGRICDVNKDGKVDVADISTILTEMAAQSRMQTVMEE